MRQFFGPAPLRLHRRAVVQNKLPTPVAPHEDIRKSECHRAELPHVRAFQILRASHDRRVAVSGNFHVHVLNEFWLDSVLVSSPDPAGEVTPRYLKDLCHAGISIRQQPDKGNPG
jgi:hypothetical protein